MLRPLQTHFLLFQIVFFVLVCIHPGTPRVPPPVLASGSKPCGGNKYSLSLYVYTWGLLGCLLGFWPLGQNPAKAITTEFGYAKCDLRLAAYDGVVLQRFQIIKVCMGKNGNRHYSWNVFNKNGLPQCLVVFSIVISLLSLIRSLLSGLAHFCFPLLRKRNGCTFDSWPTPLEAKKKNTEIPPAAPIPPQNHSTGLSAAFQLHSKPNSSPQRTI